MFVGLIPIKIFLSNQFFKFLREDLSTISISSKELLIIHYTTLTNLSTKYLVMCKVYADVGGIK